MESALDRSSHVFEVQRWERMLNLQELNFEQAQVIRKSRLSYYQYEGWFNSFMWGSIFCFSSWCLFLFLPLSCFLSLLCHFALTGPSSIYSFFLLPAPSFVYCLVTVLSQLFEVIPHQVYVRAKMHFHSKCIMNCPIGTIRYCILLCGFP